MWARLIAAGFYAARARIASAARTWSYAAWAWSRPATDSSAASSTGL